MTDLTAKRTIIDVENRIKGPNVAESFEYSYAPGNKRVWRGVWTTDPDSGITSLTTDEVTFWSVTGQKLATYQIQVGTNTLQMTQTGTNYYFGAKLIKNAGGYVVADRLGSIGKFYPWGQEKPSATTNGTEKFTGYFRDAETGLDYADQRYHNPGTGRFMTPDPYVALSTGAADPTNPGSWNRYAYVQGDPINGTDARGREVCVSPDGEPCIDDPCDDNDFEDSPYDCGEGGGCGPPPPKPTKPQQPSDGPCDIMEQFAPVPGTFHAGVHTYLDVEINGAWSVIEATYGNSANPVSKNAQMDAIITPGLNSGIEFNGKPVDHPGTGPGADHVEFDAQKDTTLTNQQLCADAQAIMNGATSFQQNHAPGSAGAVPYNLFGSNGIPNSNSFIRYLLTFAPNLGTVPHSIRARGWNDLVLGR